MRKAELLVAGLVTAALVSTLPALPSSADGVAVPFLASASNTASSLQDAAGSHPLTMLSVSDGSASGDRMCWQEDFPWITSVANADAQAGANFATVETPMDAAASYIECPPSRLDPIAYEMNWVRSIRAAGMHVWFRQQWNSWAGNYGSRKLTVASKPAIPYETRRGMSAVLDGTDRTSYLAKTYRFILGHPGLYVSGDAFTPVGEPQDAGIGNCSSCQFPSFAAMNQFLRDSITLDRQAFAQLGVHVTVGLDGTSCDYQDLEPATVAVMGVVGVDCYVNDLATLKRDLLFIHGVYSAPIVISEWGPLFTNGNQPATTLAIRSTLTALLQIPYVTGLDYWQAYGGTVGENVFDPARMGLSQAGQELGRWYQLSGTIARERRTRLQYLRS